jgi:hypothetical protein
MLKFFYQYVFVTNYLSVKSTHMMFFKSQSSCTLDEISSYISCNNLQKIALIIVRTGDRESLPYTEATVLEISRLASVLPIAPPRQVERRNNCLASYIYAVQRDVIGARKTK